MTALFKRVVNVSVGPRGSPGALGALKGSMAFDLSNLDCVFHVKKSLKPEPNTCELHLYNLARPTRSVLETAERLFLRLDAGYPGSVGQIFLGEVRSAHSRPEGADIITEISTGDSEKELATSRINLSVGPNVHASYVLAQLAQALGGGLGNVSAAVAKLTAKGATFFGYGQGTAFAGNAAEELTTFCRAVDLEWSIQDGVLQILERGTPIEAQAVLLSPSTGLIGTPSVDHKGIASATALIQPDLTPGRKVTFDSMGLSGTYRITDCEFSGDTAGSDWYVKLTADSV